MNLILEIYGEKKNFALGTIKGKTQRRYYEIRDILIDAEKGEVEYRTEHFDMMVSFICECFNNKFTEDDLLDNLDITDINIWLMKIQKFIEEKTAAKMKKIAKNS
ncbi:phage tail assembly chaperone G [Clostridium sardiniense]|uniref:phage tail assembly chaperone G n=1 Tax=Clostridium sardiniense TaxID=29369 RepID=UPI003D329490